MAFIVLKFGGTSVSTRERWDTIGREIKRCRDFGHTPVVVCSALTGVSDLLDSLSAAALEEKHESVLAEVRKRHQEMADKLEVDVSLEEELNLLERLATGISLTREATPRLKAQMMATGELMSTRLGVAYLKSQGQNVQWWDARELLTTDPPPENPELAYLSATCQAAPDPGLQTKLADGAHLTQGFIARNPNGDTVLLGRGGSDTSAAYLAAMLGARECEIWTDVPGLYTADPRQVPTARLLRKLDYREAQELASLGAKVLHPRCLPPLREAGIPLLIRCTQAPQLEGTRISPSADEAGEGQVKAVSSKARVTLISMESQGMWQQVGFLSDVFACFKNHDLSIDLVATSESNVTVSLDSAANLVSAERLNGLLRELSVHCRPKVISPCAVVSLVGQRIRSILHRLAPALELFEEEQVHLVSQASSDLNLTFVVDQAQAEKLVVSLHSLLFSGPGDATVLGPTWQEQFQPEPPALEMAPGVEPLWLRHRDRLGELETPCYVYGERELRAAAERVLALKPLSRVYYAIKANPHAGILRLFGELGLGFECVSPGELEHVFNTVPGAALLYTPNFASREDYEAGFRYNAQVTLDNLDPLDQWPDLFENRQLFVRVDPGRGGGHHRHVRTAGPQSKFGVAPDQLPGLAERLAKLGSRVIGLHAHSGSGILDPASWQRTATILAQAGEHFPDARILDLGGGLGVPDRSSVGELDMARVQELLERFCTANPGYQLWLEPGRYLVAQAGILLTRVNQTKRKGEKRFVGVDGGMNCLLRPALYGAYHEILNLTRLDQPRTVLVDVVGPICETGDVLGRDRLLPETTPGDLLVVATAGAYGHCMASTYNLRPLPTEHLLA